MSCLWKKENKEGGEGWEGLVVILPAQRMIVLGWGVCARVKCLVYLPHAGTLGWVGLFAACVSAAAAAGEQYEAKQAILGHVWLGLVWFGLVCLDGPVSGEGGWCGKKTTRQQDKMAWEGWIMGGRTDGQEGRGECERIHFISLTLPSGRLDLAPCLTFSWVGVS